MTFALCSTLPRGAVQRLQPPSRAPRGAPLRVSASVLWSLHKKGTRSDGPAVVDLSCTSFFFPPLSFFFAPLSLSLSALPFLLSATAAQEHEGSSSIRSRVGRE